MGRGPLGRLPRPAATASRAGRGRFPESAWCGRWLWWPAHPWPPPPTPGVVVDVDACVPHSTPAPPDPRPPLRRPHKARGRTRPHSPSLHVQKKTVHIPPKGGGGRRASPGVRLEGVVAPCTSTDTNNPCDMDGRREEGGRGRWAGPLRGGHDDGGTNVLNVVWGGGECCSLRGGVVPRGERRFTSETVTRSKPLNSRGRDGHPPHCVQAADGNRGRGGGV